MAEATRRPTSVTVARTAAGSYEATNERGGRITTGTGEDSDFTPVELLLAAIAGCASVDVDLPATRRVEPDAFRAVATGDRVRDDSGSRLDDIQVSFDIRFPDGEAGARAQGMLAQLLRQSHDRLCTVSRTVEAGTPVSMRLA